MGPISSSQSPPDDRHAGRPIVAVIEDNPDDVFMIREAIAIHRLDLELHVFEDGEKAIELIANLDSDEHKICPKLMLLDLNLPRADGFEVLGKLRTSKRCRQIPVVIMTSSAAPADWDKSAALGGSVYFRKPSEYEAFLKIGEIMERYLNGSKTPPRSPPSLME